jgi:hypothetical protein
LDYWWNISNHNFRINKYQNKKLNLFLFCFNKYFNAALKLFDNKICIVVV